MDDPGGFSVTAQSRLAAFFALFMGLVIAVFIATGLTLAYPPPGEPTYPDWNPDGVTTPAEQHRYEQELVAYEEQSETRSIVLGVLGLALGTALAAAGLGTERRIGVLGNGLVMGGLFTIAWANARFLYPDYAYPDGSRLLVAVIAGVLSALIFVAVGWWKFVHELTPQDIDVGSRRQLHGIYTVLLAAALVYAFSLIWVYARTPIDTYHYDAYAGEALMYAIYSLVYSTALVSVGLALGGKRLGALSGGFVLAGFAGLLSSIVGALLDTGDTVTKFLFVTFALGVTTTAGYLRFIRKPKTATVATAGAEVALPEAPESIGAPRTSPDPFAAALPVVVGHLAAQRDRRVLWDPHEQAFMLDAERLDAARVAELQASHAVLWYPDVIAEHPAVAAALRTTLGR